MFENEDFSDEELQQPLKVSILREELVKLTQDSNKAIVLNQFLYWSERTKTAAGFVREEMDRIKKYTEDQDTSVLDYLAEDLNQGWIYKSAVGLIEDTMLTVSKATMNRIISDLVEKKWILKRKNPRWRGDNTPQYRVNLFKIQLDLYELGYSLSGYRLIRSVIDFAEINRLKEAYKDISSEKKEGESTSTQIDSGSTHNETTRAQNDSGSSQIDLQSTQIDSTLPEVNTQITRDNLNKNEEEEEINKKGDGHVTDIFERFTEILAGNEQLAALTRYLKRQGVNLEDIAKICIFLSQNQKYINNDLIVQQVARNNKINRNEGLCEYAEYFIRGLVKFGKNMNLNFDFESEDEFLGLSDLPKVSLYNVVTKEDYKPD